jgi:hypothetical protein
MGGGILDLGERTTRLMLEVAARNRRTSQYEVSMAPLLRCAINIVVSGHHQP